MTKYECRDCHELKLLDYLGRCTDCHRKKEYLYTRKNV